MARPNRGLIVLPPKPFFYTVDQIAQLVGSSNPTSFATKYVFREGHDVGARSPRQLRAINIDPEWRLYEEWRIHEGELKRWLRFIGVGYTDNR